MRLTSDSQQCSTVILSVNGLGWRPKKIHSLIYSTVMRRNCIGGACRWHATLHPSLMSACIPIIFVVTAMQLSLAETSWAAPADPNTWSIANAWAAPELLTVRGTVHSQKDNDFFSGLHTYSRVVNTPFIFTDASQHESNHFQDAIL